MDEPQSLDEIMREEFDRVEVLDAAFDAASQLKNGNSALKHVLLQAKDDAREAVHKLINCDPYKGDVVRDLQWQVKRYDMLCKYVSDVIEIGQMAANDLTDEQLAETARLIRGEQADIED